MNGIGGVTNGATPLTQNVLQARANASPTWYQIPGISTTAYALLQAFC